jgi:hypothetical protein
VVVHNSNPSTLEAETGDHKFEASWLYSETLAQKNVSCLYICEPVSGLSILALVPPAYLLVTMLLFQTL